MKFNRNIIKANISYCALKMALELDNYSKIKDLDENKKNKIKLKADNIKKYIIVLLEYIL